MTANKTLWYDEFRIARNFSTLRYHLPTELIIFFCFFYFFFYHGFSGFRHLSTECNAKLVSIYSPISTTVRYLKEIERNNAFRLLQKKKQQKNYSVQIWVSATRSNESTSSVYKLFFFCFSLVLWIIIPARHLNMVCY